MINRNRFNFNNFIGCTLLILPIIVLYSLILYYTNNNFTYTLDDPYIHLALAKNIWLGNYGINISENSAPSSSILWPFLLAPLSNFNFFEYSPLLINIICLIVSGLILTKLIGGSGLIPYFISFSLMLLLNFYGLVFTGMEHNLQLLLVIMIAYMFLNKDVLQNKKISILFFLSLILLPLIRYEGLAISIPVLLYIYLYESKKKSLISIISIFILLLLFSLFLYSRGLGFLPSSVLSKTSGMTGNSVIHSFISNVFHHPISLIVNLTICFFIWKKDKKIGLMLLSVLTLHFIFGKFGWYGRYEIYFYTFIATFSILYLQNFIKKYWYLSFLLALPFKSFLYCTVTTPLASSNIFNQQAQMGIIAKMLKKNIAVNDLGLVALRGGNFTLDLWGLGSIQALNYRKIYKSDDVEWMSTLMHAKNTQFAFVYKSWFPSTPKDWIYVGSIKLLQKRITPADSVVNFYATSPAAAVELRKTLEIYNQTKECNHCAIQLEDNK